MKVYKLVKILEKQLGLNLVGISVSHIQVKLLQISLYQLKLHACSMKEIYYDMCISLVQEEKKRAYFR